MPCTRRQLRRRPSSLLITHSTEANQRLCLQEKALRPCLPPTPASSAGHGHRHASLLFRACSPAKSHIVYSIRADASMQSLTEVSGRQDSARLMAVRAVDRPSPPGGSTGAVDTLAAFALAIRCSKRGTTEAYCAEVPKQEGHVPTDAR